MAKKTLIIDDITGETGARTHAFRLDGVEYEIDLTDSSLGELRTALKPYLRAARQVSASGIPAPRARRRLRLPRRNPRPRRLRSSGPGRERTASPSLSGDVSPHRSGTRGWRQAPPGRFGGWSPMQERTRPSGPT